MLEYALHYASLGWPVFPCGKDKRPLSPHGFKDATTEETVIRQWWGASPDAMIGLPTGSPSGIWAVDCDGAGLGTQEFADLCAANGGMPETLYQDTPSGGRHYLFQWTADAPVKNSAKKLGSHVDTRGEGGYIILAPSTRADGKEYAWGNADVAPGQAPDWLIQRTMGKKTAQLSPYVQKALDSEAEKVASAPEGSRNDTLNSAAFAIGTLVGGGELTADVARDTLLQAAAQSGIEQHEAELTISSGITAGVSHPRTSPDARAFPEEIIDTYVIAGDDFYERRFIIDPAVEELFDQGEIVLINAKSGTGKGLLTMELALEMGAVVEQQNGFDFNQNLLWGKFHIPKMRRTLFIQAENRSARTHQKLHMMVEKNPELGRGLPNIGFLSFDNEDIRTSGSFMKDNYLTRIMSIVKEQHFDTIIFDPLVNFLDVDENDNREVNEALQRLVDFQKQCPATIILVHHIGKKEGDYDGRGASAIRAKADTLIAFARIPEKQIKDRKDIVVLTGIVSKVRHARDGYSEEFIRTDGEFILRLMTKEMKAESDDANTARVIETLTELGGQCEMAGQLKEALAAKYKVTQKWAEQWVRKAKEAGAICQTEKKGNKKGYSLPLTQGADDTSMVTSMVTEQGKVDADCMATF